MKCSQCGAQIGLEDKFCERCGTKITKDKEVKDSVKSEGKSDVVELIFGCIIVILGCLFKGIVAIFTVVLPFIWYIIEFIIGIGVILLIVAAYN